MLAQRLDVCRAAGLLLACFVLAPLAAHGQVRVDGSYRIRFSDNSNLALDERPTLLGQRRWAEHRLRLTPKIIADQIELQGSFDLISGLFAGDLAPSFQGLGYRERSRRNGLEAEGFDFRHLFATIRLPNLLLEVGQMPSHWGMGLLTHGGNTEDEADFGDVRFGDIVDRFRVATRPLTFLGPRSALARDVVASGAADLIYRDRSASLVTRVGGNSLQVNDVAWQGVGQIVWQPAELTRVGLRFARRVQNYGDNAGDLHIWTVDLHLRGLLTQVGGGIVTAEAELADVVGGTTHTLVPGQLRSTRIGQQGAVARLLYVRGPLETELEGGYASGESSAFDATSSGFQMNRDFKVGLVLFDEVLLFQTQNAAQRLADPNLGGTPPLGLDRIPTEGAVTNALYLKPTVRYRLPFWDRRLRAVGSVLLARAPQPVIDAYQSQLASAPRNAFGAEARRNYGVEVDLSLAYQWRVAESLGLELGVQGGYLMPGDAFNRPDGSRMPGAGAAKVRGTLLF